jgi:hypothetical protein
VASGRMASDTVVAVGLYGDHLRVRHGSRGGWDATGAERVVTRAQGNVLYALDDQPALALYKEHLGDRAAELPGSALMYPLLVRGAAGHGVVRAVVGVDEVAQSLTIAAEVPPGSHARLMQPGREETVTAQVAGRPAGGFEGSVLCVAISCVGRRQVLGERSKEEVRATLESLPVGTAQVGFYSYGEISPRASGRCDLRRQTMTFTVLGETA